jgi:hypothetical protein
MKNIVGKHPYMTVRFWINNRNHYWKDGTHTPDFVKKMDEFVNRLSQCPTDAQIFKYVN